MTETIHDILLDWIDIQTQSNPGVPLLFVSGAQGIGKSTAIAHVQRHFGGRIAVLGLDDFYLTKAERTALGDAVHPLFETRGPPGTHDIMRLRDTLNTLKHADAQSETIIPRFDKRTDDRCPPKDWAVFEGRPQAILVEGWCIGALPFSDTANKAPPNSVEAGDVSGAWMQYQQDQLVGPYAELWDLADAFLHLCAPSFEQVLNWRIQQEATTLGLAEADLPDDRKAWVENFIQYYERLTRQMLSGHRRHGYALKVDTERRPLISRQTPLIVFSDLDGTLLDHKTYAFEPAKPALQKIRNTDSVLVLASSKTAAEISDIRQKLGVEHCPAIVENGAGILEAGQSLSSLSDEIYMDIRSVLDRTPAELRVKFEGFGDCTADSVSQITGLSVEAARHAKMRCFSEPGRWSGGTDELDAFLQYLASFGLSARRGGRFMTLSFGATKADQMFEIASRFAPAPTLALGDAPNDIEMLESANYAVIIKNSGGTEIPILRSEPAGGVTRTTDEGPVGWNTEVLDLMQRLAIGRKTE